MLPSVHRATMSISFGADRDPALPAAQLRGSRQARALSVRAYALLDRFEIKPYTFHSLRTYLAIPEDYLLKFVQVTRDKL